VIDGNEEARLIYESCRNDFGHLGNIAVLDIGGGSTEIVTAEEMTSFPFGVVTLTDKFLRSDPPKKEEIEQLRQFVSTFISSSAFRRPYSGVGRRATNDGRLIATAGTPTTLMAIHLGLKKYDSTKVHGQRLTVNNIHHLKNRLEAMTLSERVKIPCLPEKRADVIIAGINILLTVMDFLKCDSILISDHGLRYGALRDFIKKSPSS
jgi:exopolyphosphatase/guanosine-5'-triphosphate,3'-diphosphate pyrophosphatase